MFWNKRFSLLGKLHGNIKEMMLVVVLLFFFLSTYSIQNEVNYCLFKCFFIRILVDSVFVVIIIIITTTIIFLFLLMVNQEVVSAITHNYFV